MIHLSFIIPAYNEAARLPETLKLVKDFLATQDYTWEVVVVDDGSKDETVALVQKEIESFPGLRIITNIENKGKGGVVRQGMLEAVGDYRLFMDADNSTPIQEVTKLLKHIPDYQIVIGSRYLDPSSIKIRQPLKRRIISRSCNWIIQHLLLPGIVDTQCGFKLFSAEAAEKIFAQQTMKGWSFDIELLVIGQKMGYAIKEVPVDWFDAKKSNLRASRDGVKFIRDLITIRQKVYQREYN